MLAQWASVDPYYKTVITKYHGIEAIVQAMTYFSTDADAQVYGCTALGHLTNKALVRKAGGVTVMMDALENHPSHLEVQSHALEALKKQGGLLREESAQTCAKLSTLVQHSQQLYLTKPGHEGRAFLWQFLQTFHPQGSSKTSTARTNSSSKTTRAA